MKNEGYLKTEGYMWNKSYHMHHFLHLFYKVLPYIPGDWFREKGYKKVYFSGKRSG